VSSTRSSSPGATGPVVDRFDDEEDVIFLVDSPAASRKGIVATMDGDGQMDPQYLSKFLDPIVDGKCDLP
jgi:hypothetical protein